MENSKRESNTFCTNFLINKKADICRMQISAVFTFPACKDIIRDILRSKKNLCRNHSPSNQNT